jgi:hypothetical protein
MICHPNTEVLWIQKNQDYLWEHFAGKWIAVEGEQLLAVGDSATEVHQEAIRKGFPDAIITGVRRREYHGFKLIRLA